MSAHKSLLYTGTGDRGTTSLVSGHRVAKHHMRIEAYGTVDELNSHLGVVAALSCLSPERKEELLWIQNKLFDLGAYLANDTPGAATGITPDNVIRLQSMIDMVDEKLPALNRFVLPGGHIGAAQCHVARTVCRRAERRMTALAEATPVDSDALVFVNRLSDYLFALARHINICTHSDEIFWQKNC